MRILILLFFLLSGACGLVYEVVWTRLLTLVIGSTTYSMTTVLVAFMGGLALGSYLGGRWIDKKGDPLVAYGVLEGLIGLYCLAVPFIVSATEPLFAFFYNRYYTDQYYLYSLARFAVCGVVLLVPTTMMGATLPILSKYLIRRKAEIGWDAGRLYALNTLGAVVGCFGSGFILLPFFGKWRSILIAAAANLFICAVVLVYRLVLKRGGDASPELEKAPAMSATGKSARMPALVLITLLAYAMNGFAGMSYQIAWTRAMSLSFGASTYAFSMIVTIFILGLAFGSGASARIVDRLKNPAAFFGWIEALIGFSSVGVIWALGRLPLWMVPVIVKYKTSYDSLLAAQFGIVFAMIFIPTFLMGMTFPLAVKIVGAGGEGIGKPVGLAYGWNTAGAITGSFVAGFVLVPMLGIQKTIMAGNFTNWAAGALLLVWGWALAGKGWKSWRTPLAFAPALLGLIVSIKVPAWDKQIMDSGPFVYAEGYVMSEKLSGMSIEQLMKENDLLFHKEGIDTTVSVIRSAEGSLIFMRVNGKTDASSGGDMSTQELVGHIPMVLAKNRDDVLIVGLASGVTLGSVTRYEVKSVDVVEISDAVVEASHYFKKWNYDSLSDPRVNLIVADGRNHLHLTDKKYDVIISQPSNPWISGISSLFTKEYFEAAKARLKDGGVFCCWFQAYRMRDVEFRMVMKTFREVFPDASMWEAHYGVDYFLVGGTGKLDINPDRVVELMKQEPVAADLARVGINNPESVFSFFFMTGDTMAEIGAGSETHTDDRLQVEYRAPRYLYENTFPDLYRSVLRYGENIVDARALRVSETMPNLAADINKMVEARTLFLKGMNSESLQRLEDARIDYEKSVALDPGSKGRKEVYYSLLMDMGLGLVKKGDFENAKLMYERAGEIMPESNIVYDRLGAALLAQGKLDEAGERFAKALAINPKDAIAMYNLGYIAMMKQDFAEAERKFAAAIKAAPKYADALNGMGVIMIQYQRRDEAVKYFEKALKVRPGFADGHKNLGLILLQSAGDRKDKKREGLKHLKKALELDPTIPDRERMEELMRKTEAELGGSEGL